MSVKWHQFWCWWVLFTSVDKRYIWKSLSFFMLFGVHCIIIYFPVFVVTILSSCHLSWFLTRFVTRLKRRMPLVKWEPLPFQSRVHSGYSEVCVAQCLVLCVGFCGRSLSVALSYSFWSLHCMSFFDLRLLNTIWYLQNVLMTLVILSSFTKLLM